LEKSQELSTLKVMPKYFGLSSLEESTEKLGKTKIEINQDIPIIKK